jgi:dolichol-phosphate mannosyltransferase
MESGVAIAIPTYNEIENIQKLIPAIRRKHGSARIFVVDDNSPDGTADAVKRMSRQWAGLELIWRKDKNGLAAAYLDAFAKILANRDIELIITMDADLSHNPEDLDSLLQGQGSSDLVVGSRYVRGGGIQNWSFWRRALSKYGNHYARFVTGTPVRDLTSGFVMYHRTILEKILRTGISSRGYAYQIEMKYLAYQQGARIKEVPITFCDRGGGISKLERGVVWEGMVRPWSLRFRGNGLKHGDR